MTYKRPTMAELIQRAKDLTRGETVSEIVSDAAELTDDTIKAAITAAGGGLTYILNRASGALSFSRNKRPYQPAKDLPVLDSERAARRAQSRKGQKGKK